jgi:hypothetical protein
MPSKAEIQRKENERTEAIATLRRKLSPGDTLYTILRHVSQSGMQRTISVVRAGNGEIESLDYLIARLGYTWKKSSTGYGIKVNGAGMDMGFHLVYGISSIVFEDGYAIKHEWL